MRLGIDVIALFSTLLLVGSARADVIPPDVWACQNKQVGDTCTNNGPGVCQAQTCTKLDYANWNRDASSGPPSVSYACNQCVPTTNTATSTQTSTTTTTLTNTVTQTTTNTGTVTPTQTATDTGTNTAKPIDTSSTTNTDVGTSPPTATATHTKTQSNDEPPPSNDDGSCSVGKQITAKRIAPWLLASTFSLLFLWGRRRRR